MNQKSNAFPRFGRVITATGVVALLGASGVCAGELKVKDFVPSFFGSNSDKPEAAPGAAPAAAPVRSAATPAPASAPAGSDEVIARVGGTELKASDIRTYLAALSPSDRAALAQNPAGLSQFVRLILVNQIVLKQALAKQWDQQPENAALLQRVRDSAVTEAYLQSVSKPAANFPADADLQKVYDANKSAFAVPRQYRLAQIYVTAGKDGDQAKDKGSQKVASISADLKQPNADFAAIARAKSDATETAKTGGEIGWVAEPQLRSEVKTLVLGLNKGGVTESVQVDDGWQFIKVLDIKEARTQTFAEVREALVQKLREQQAAANRRNFVAELLKQNAPVLNELALSKLLGGASASATTTSTQ
jgi:parvulin-like peptidyl-prolyl isomerase